MWCLAMSRHGTKRSLRVSLAINLGADIHQVGPTGMDGDEARRLRTRFGPLSGMVLASLRDVGLVARRDELDELAAAIVTDVFPPGSEGESDGSVRAAMLMWRTIATFAQMADEVSALANSLEQWHGAGRPRFMDCRVGENYLRSVSSGSPTANLERWRSPRAVQTLLQYPARDELAPYFLTPRDARHVTELCRRSRRATADAFARIAELMTPDVWRTFIRWKHRLTGTSPSVVPLWIPRQDEAMRAALDARFERGFGVIDWNLQSEPELILWPADREDFLTYLSAGRLAEALMTLLLDSTLRYGLLGVPALPWFVTEERAPSSYELGALDRLEASQYRLQRLIAEVAPQGTAGYSA